GAGGAGGGDPVGAGGGRRGGGGGAGDLPPGWGGQGTSAGGGEGKGGGGRRSGGGGGVWDSRRDRAAHARSAARRCFRTPIFFSTSSGSTNSPRSAWAVPRASFVFSDSNAASRSRSWCARRRRPSRMTSLVVGYRPLATHASTKCPSSGVRETWIL